MRNNEEIMTAAKFFGEIDEEMNTPSRKTRPRGKRKPDDLFAELKIKMVMRIYGVSRARAIEIIAGRADEKQEMGRAEERPSASLRRQASDDEELMSAADFFGED